MVSGSTVRLITLDLDDTLWPCKPVIQAAEQTLFDWLTRHAPGITARHDIHSLREHRKALAEERPDLAHDLTKLRVVQLELLMAEHGHERSLAKRGSEVFREARNRVSPYPDVLPALQRLRREHVLISVTNGNAQVEHTPLAGCFHHNLSAAEVGAAKPDPAMFHAACELAGVVPEQCLHVGDDPQRDIAAASAVGMCTAWINRHGAAWPAGLPVADLQASDLATLTTRLTSWNEEAHP